MSDYIHKPFITIRDGLKIKGIYYLPENNETDKIVILSHEFGVSKFNTEEAAIIFARNNIAALIFDFTGGGSLDGRSDGEEFTYSVLTQAKDLEAVIRKIVEENKYKYIFLDGYSQGGIVSTIAAAKMQDKLSGLILNYPAFVIPDYVTNRFKSKDNIPEFSLILGSPVGKKYNEDMFDYDVFNDIKSLKIPVLIFHGNKDKIVPINYSIKAEKLLKKGILVKIENEGHGFSRKAKLESIVESMRFIDSISFLKENM